jgi:competence protein ComEC
LQKKNKSLFGIAHTLREKINSELKAQDFSKNELSIYNAILLGQRQDISKETFTTYKNAGAIHILAVSGLHIGIILMILNFLFQPIGKLKQGKIIKLVVVVLFLWVYALIAGLSPSVIRAVTMFTSIAIGITLNRPSGVKNSLVASLFFLLLGHPLFLFDVGFQLSYSAVFSIVWLQPFFSKLWKPKHKAVQYFWQLLTVSFAAQIGVLPLTLFYFHQFPGLFFVSSLVIIPILGLLLSIGFLVAILALLDFLPKQLVDFYEILLEAMNKIVEIISKQETFLFEGISFSILLMVSSYMLLIFTMTFLQQKNIKNAFLFLSAVLLLQATLFYEKKKKQEKNEFIFFQETANSVFVHRKNEKVIVYKNLDTINRNLSRPVKSYILGNNLEISERKPIKNYFKSEKTSMLVIDSFGIYYPLKIYPEIVILTQSPKINLDRLIEILQPKMIIADGSNYKSYINRWQKTCGEKKINFYDTSKMGAFVTNY